MPRSWIEDCPADTLLQTELQSDKYKNKAEISALEAEVESLNLHLQQEQQAAAKLQVRLLAISKGDGTQVAENRLLLKTVTVW